MGTLNFRLVNGVGEALVVRDYQGHKSASDSRDAPGRYKDDANGKAFSQIRLESLHRVKVTKPSFRPASYSP